LRPIARPVHIAAVHCRDVRWLPIQARGFARHTPAGYRICVAHDGLVPSGLEAVEPLVDARGLIAPRGWDPGSKPTMLEALADAIAESADEDDVLVFVHGDTLPIGDWVPMVERTLAEYPLTAVRRAENVEEPWPHACFCATTVGFWKRLGGSWANGPTWTGADKREVTDHGAVLWRQLADGGHDWLPILRTNGADPHPLFFAIYGETIYHHGAGFRTPMSRRDAMEVQARWPAPLNPPVRWLRARRNGHLSRRMYKRVRDDPEFHRAIR
jgi:hypothetical protein